MTFNLRERRRQFLISADRIDDLAAEGLVLPTPAEIDAPKLSPLTPDEWIEKFGRAEFESEGLSLAPCECGDPACRGWRAVYPD